MLVLSCSLSNAAQAQPLLCGETCGQVSLLLWLACGSARLWTAQASPLQQCQGRGLTEPWLRGFVAWWGERKTPFPDTFASVGVNTPLPPGNFTVLTYTSGEPIPSIEQSVSPSVSLFPLVENHVIELFPPLSSPRARN